MQHLLTENYLIELVALESHFVLLEGSRVLDLLKYAKNNIVFFYQGDNNVELSNVFKINKKYCIIKITIKFSYII